MLVLGGAGFYGARVVQALRARGVHVEVGSRRGAVRVDLRDSGTFGAFERWDAVVDAADSVNAPPDAACRHVLEHGGLWVEAGADLAATERLLALPVGRAVRGAVVVGAGVFPGLSTALGAALAAAGPSPASVELAVRLSPLSGAGPGNVDLMMAALESPGVRWRGGRRLEGHPIQEARTVGFPSGAGAAVAVGLPDVALLRAVTGAPEVTTRMALVPDLFRFSFGALSALLRMAGPLRPALRALLRWQLLALRAWLLRGRESFVEVAVTVDLGLPTERTSAWRFDDGMEAMAEGVAAATVRLLRDPPAPGVHPLTRALEGRALLRDVGVSALG